MGSNVRHIMVCQRGTTQQLPCPQESWSLECRSEFSNSNFYIGKGLPAPINIYFDKSHDLFVKKVYFHFFIEAFKVRCVRVHLSFAYFYVFSNVLLR